MPFNSDRQPLTTAERGTPTSGGSQPAKGELRWMKDKGLYSFHRFQNKWYGSKLGPTVGEFAIERIITDKLTAKNDLLITAGTHDVFFGRIKDKINIGSQDVSLDIWTGEGWRGWFDENDMFNFEVDNLVVRNEMWVNSFILNQVRAQNGDEVVSSAGKILSVEVVSTNVFDIIFEVDNAVDAQPFAQYDLLLGRTLSVDEVTTLTNVRLTVDAITVDGNAAKITATRVAGTSTPSTGDVVARVGNTITASRMGSVWIIAESNQGPPFIDVRSGIDSWAKHDDPISNGCVKARLGRLDALTGGTNEFGLSTSNIYLTQDVDGANQILYGTAAERTAYDTNLLNDGDIWVTSDVQNNQWQWNGSAWVDVVDDTIFTTATGLLNKAPAPSGSGLYLGSTHMGFYNGSAWRGYWEIGGDFWLKGAGDTCLWWDYSAATLYMGGTTSGDAYLKTSAGAGNIKFYDTNNVNVLSLGSNLSGNFSGITLDQKGFIYKHNDSNNAVSTVHSELYNQTTNYIGGISTLVSTTTDASTPPLPSTQPMVCAYKGLVYLTGSYQGAVSQFVARGYSTGHIFGIHLDVDNYSAGYNTGISINSSGQYVGLSGAGISVAANNNVNYTTAGSFYGYSTSGEVRGVIGEASGTSTSNIGVWGKASGATTNWAGYFSSGNVNINNTLYFGSGSDVNLYRSAANVLKTDDNLYVAQQLRFDAGTTSADGLLWGSDVNLYRSSANVLKTDDVFKSATHIYGDRFYPGLNTTYYLDHDGSNFIFNSGIDVDAVKFSGGNTLLTYITSLRCSTTFDIQGNLTLSGNVDGVDIAAFKTDYDAKINQDLRTTASPNFTGLKINISDTFEFISSDNTNTYAVTNEYGSIEIKLAGSTRYIRTYATRA